MNVVVKPAKHSAPGQYLGFALQPVRLCYHLLTCPRGSTVSIEHLDDIAVHLPNGEHLLEQTKSALSQNPISNWAVDLWKTLANWLDFIEAGDVPITALAFQLYVSPTKSGTWASRLDAVANPEDASALLSEIRVDFEKQQKPPACAPFVKRILDADPSVSTALIVRINVISEEDPLEPLKKLIEVSVDSRLIEIICQAGIGIAKERADRLIRQGKPAVLDADNFKAIFLQQIQKANLPGLLASLTQPPGDTEVQSVLSARPTFIRQLEIIQADSDLRLKAVSDFLRSSADKTHWAENGQIFEENLREWDNELVHRQSLVATEVQDTMSDKDGHVRGRVVYTRCAQLQPPLDGRAVPTHFVNGCYNALADQRRLGWHPDYVSLLDGADE